MNTLPYEEILRRGERHYSSSLLARLTQPSLSKEEREEVVRCLFVLSDPRTFAPLRALLLDPEQPREVWKDAGTILRNMEYGPDEDEAQLRRWWEGEDPVLQRHALYSMGQRCRDIVVAVARDPQHPLHSEAISMMEHFFEHPDHQALKIAALSHPEPKVRENAAYALLWDEPAAAEEPLLRLTSDPEPNVAAEVCRTLKYYPTQRVLRRMHALQSSPHQEIRKKAKEAFEDIRSSCLDKLTSQNSAVQRHLRRWLAPVWDLLGFSEEELRPKPEYPSGGPHSAGEKRKLPLPELMGLLSDPDAAVEALREACREADWTFYSPEERAALRAFFLQNPDPLVRYQAMGAFEAWGDQEGLLVLLDDPDFLVRKSATYYLGKTLPPGERIAALLWERLTGGRRFGVHATETLSAYVAHAPPRESIPRLFDIARAPEQPESLRYTAISKLRGLEAREALLDLSFLLTEPPQVTWGLHIRLLDHFVELGLPAPDISWLFAVDHLDVQRALAPFVV